MRVEVVLLVDRERVLREHVLVDERAPLAAWVRGRVAHSAACGVAAQPLAQLFAPDEVGDAVLKVVGHCIAAQSTVECRVCVQLGGEHAAPVLVHCCVTPVPREADSRAGGKPLAVAIGMRAVSAGELAADSDAIEWLAHGALADTGPAAADAVGGALVPPSAASSAAVQTPGTMRTTADSADSAAASAGGGADGGDARARNSAYALRSSSGAAHGPAASAGAAAGARLGILLFASFPALCGEVSRAFEPLQLHREALLEACFLSGARVSVSFVARPTYAGLVTAVESHAAKCDLFVLSTYSAPCCSTDATAGAVAATATADTAAPGIAQAARHASCTSECDTADGGCCDTQGAPPLAASAAVANDPLGPVCVEDACGAGSSVHLASAAAASGCRVVLAFLYGADSALSAAASFSARCELWSQTLERSSNAACAACAPPSSDVAAPPAIVAMWTRSVAPDSDFEHRFMNCFLRVLLDGKHASVLLAAEASLEYARSVAPAPSSADREASAGVNGTGIRPHADTSWHLTAWGARDVSLSVQHGQFVSMLLPATQCASNLPPIRMLFGGASMTMGRQLVDLVRLMRLGRTVINVHAPAGRGKSVLAYALAQRLVEQRLVTAAILCQANPVHASLPRVASLRDLAQVVLAFVSFIAEAESRTPAATRIDAGQQWLSSHAADASTTTSAVHAAGAGGGVMSASVPHELAAGADGAHVGPLNREVCDAVQRLGECLIIFDGWEAWSPSAQQDLFTCITELPRNCTVIITARSALLARHVHNYSMVRASTPVL